MIGHMALPVQKVFNPGGMPACSRCNLSLLTDLLCPKWEADFNKSIFEKRRARKKSQETNKFSLTLEVSSKKWKLFFLLLHKGFI